MATTTATPSAAPTSTSAAAPASSAAAVADNPAGPSGTASTTTTTSAPQARYVTAATFDPTRLVFGEFESKPVGRGGESATFECIPILYRYKNDPSDPGSTLKWASPVMVSPRGFTFRAINGKNECSYMVVYDVDDNPDWDEDTLARMKSEPAYSKLKNDEWAARQRELRAQLDEEIEAQNALTDATIAHIESLKKAKGKIPQAIKNFNGDGFGRLPYCKDPSEEPDHFSAWMKLMDIPASMTKTNKAAVATVTWPDGERIPKSAPKGAEGGATWRDLVDKHLNVETLFTIRGVFFGKVNKFQVSAVSVIIHSVRAAESTDPMQARAKAAMANKDKERDVSRNKARLQQLKSSAPRPASPDEEGEEGGGSGNMAEGDEEEELPRRAQAGPAAEKRNAGNKSGAPGAKTAPVRGVVAAKPAAPAKAGAKTQPAKTAGTARVAAKAPPPKSAARPAVRPAAAKSLPEEEGDYDSPPPEGEGGDDGDDAGDQEDDAAQ